VQETILGKHLIKSLACELYDVIVQDIRETRQKENTQNKSGDDESDRENLKGSVHNDESKACA